MSGNDANVGISISVSAGELTTLIKKLKESDEAARKAKEGTMTFSKSVKEAGERFLESAGHATRLHHALRIMHHLTRAAHEVFNHFKEMLSKTLEFRFDDDSIKKSVTQIERAQAAFNNINADKFAPLLHGISTVLTSLVKQWEGYSKAQEQAQRKEVIDRFVSIANVLISVVSVAIKGVATAWAGFGIIINGTQVIVNKFFAMWMSGLSSVVGAHADLAEVFGKNPLSKAMRDAEGSVKAFGHEFELSGAAAQRELVDSVHEANKLNKEVDKLEGIARKAIKDVATDAMHHLGEKTHWATTKVEGLQKQLASEAIAKSMLEAKMAVQELISKGEKFKNLEPVIDGVRDALARRFPKSVEESRKAVEGLKKELAAMMRVELFKDWEAGIKKVAMIGDQWKRTADLEDAAAKAADALEDKMVFDKAKDSFDNLNIAIARFGALTEKSKEPLGQFNEKMYDALKVSGKFGEQMKQSMGLGQLETEKLKEKIESAAHSLATIEVDKALKRGGLSGLTDAWRAFYRTKDSMGEKDAAAMQERLQEETMRTANSLRSMASEYGAMFGQAAAGSISAGQLIRQMIEKTGNAVLDLAMKWVVEGQIRAAADEAAAQARIAANTAAATHGIAANAAVAASGAASSQSPIPFVGPVLAIAAASAIFAAVMAYASKFSAGGLVPTNMGTPGRDSVLAALTPGEYVIPEPIVSQIRGGSRPTKPGHYAGGGIVDALGVMPAVIGMVSTAIGQARRQSNDSAQHRSGGHAQKQDTQISKAAVPVVHNNYPQTVHVFGTTSQAQLDRINRDTIQRSNNRMARYNYTGPVGI